MIASPGDVTDERGIVREVLHEWNDIHAAHQSVVFLPIGWETHSSPELGDRPQAQINDRMLEACDLLIGVFWTKLGSPTGDYASGTVEEIERHVDAGKPAMLYFSNQPIPPSALDSAQYNRLSEFRASCMPRGLVESYSSTEEFRSKLSRQLQRCLNDNKYLKNIIRQQEPNIVFAPAVVPARWHDPYGEPVSPDAMELLRAAAKSGDGTVLSIATIGSRSIDVGATSLGKESARDFAIWEGALNDLIQAGLVVRKSADGVVNQLTREGWALVDEI